MREQGNHLEKNKLSEKFGRRDVRFYDLYKKHRFEDDVQNLQNKGLQLEGVLSGVYTDPLSKKESEKITDENEIIYGDIEIDDFNKLFRNPDLIEEQFGESISVNL